MNLKQIEAFVSVADEGSFSKAANALFLTQPTVSAHISSLEKELGVRLFVRNTKEVSLSEEGHLLYGYAKQMIVLQKKIESTFDETRREDTGCIRIAASSVPSQYLIPHILTCFHEKYPEEQFKVMETDSAKVTEHIINGNADIGFTGAVFDRKHCTYVPFYKDDMVVITPNNLKFRKLMQLSLKKRQYNKDEFEIGLAEKYWVEKESLILREQGSGTRKEAEKLLSKMGINMDNMSIFASLENQESIKRYVKKGMGISIMSRLAAQEEIQEGKVLCFEFAEGIGKRNINVIYNKNFRLLKSVENLLNVVTEVFSKE